MPETQRPRHPLLRRMDLDPEAHLARQQRAHQGALKSIVGSNLIKGDYSLQRGIKALTEDENFYLTGNRPMTTRKGETLDRPWQSLRMLGLVDKALGGAPGAALSAGLNLRKLVPGFKKVSPHLTKAEKAALSKKNAEDLVRVFDEMPSAQEMASVAYAGRAKKGWYRFSAKSIIDVFGPEDAPRFTGLLAALSPQNPVDRNLVDALRVWNKWTAANRPNDVPGLQAVYRDALGAAKAEGMPAWTNNMTRIFRAKSKDDLARVVLSGPKVGSFMGNLRGLFEEVTNDTWMATYHGRGKGSPWALQQKGLVEAKPEFFKQSSQTVGGETLGVKSPAYMAANARAREAAKILTERTGEHWDPSKVQETVWSLVKDLYETGAKKGETRLMGDILEAGDITGKSVADIPDFGTLMQDGIFAKLLKEGGYGPRVESLAGRGGLPRGGPQSVFDPQGAGVAGRTYQRHLRDLAGRLDELKSSRKKASALKSVDEAWVGEGGASSDGRAIEAQLPQSYRRTSAGDSRRELSLGGAGSSASPLDPGDIVGIHQPVPASAEKFREAGVSAPDYVELKPTRANAVKYRAAISRAKRNSKHGAAVTVYSPEEYAQTRMFITPDGTAGFALKGDIQSDIISVFNTPGAEHKGITASALQLAIQQGGRTLDAFDTALPGIYSGNRMKTVARTPWDEAEKPKGWSYRRFREYKKGKPDVVFMTYDPARRTQTYTPGEGAPIADYGEGLALQRKDIFQSRKAGKLLSAPAIPPVLPAPAERLKKSGKPWA